MLKKTNRSTPALPAAVVPANQSTNPTTTAKPSAVAGDTRTDATRKAQTDLTTAQTRGTDAAPPPFAGQRTAKTQAVTDALPSKADAEFDYVVVGAGAAGATTAARLVEDGYKVLVVEGGKDKQVLESSIPAAHAISSDHPDLSVDGKGYDVDHFSDEDRRAKDNKHVAGRGIYYPRGEGVGGSTRMNAMIFVRPDDVDWDKIAALTGDPDWRADNMQQFMHKLEKNRYRPVLRLLHNIGKRVGVEALQNLGGHGFDGWLETTRADPKLLLRDKQLAKMVKETAFFSFKELGSLGDKVKRLLTAFDPNDNLAQGTEGFTLTPTSITGDGRRNGPRDRLLSVLAEHPDRLEIRSGCKVDKVLLDDTNEAVGVRYRDPDGKVRNEACGREVLVAGGAFESPALMLRSGIGDEAQLDALAAHGVEKKVVRPGVGRSLSDRYEYGQVFELKEGLDLAKNLALTFDDEDSAFQEWKDTGKGPYATNGAVAAFQAKSDPSIDDPDLYFFLVPGKFEGYYRNDADASGGGKYSQDAVADPKKMTLVILHENKQDKAGTVKVDLSDPSGQPKINFKYHGEEDSPLDDRLPLARGIQMGRKLIERFGDMVSHEVLPGAKYQTEEQLAEQVGNNTWGHHANGSLKMGRAGDAMSVVDSKFQVHGTKGLRVIDASTFPDNIGSFIVSAVMLQAEKAAHDVAVAARKEDDLQAKSGGMSLLSIRAGA